MTHSYIHTAIFSIILNETRLSKVGDAAFKRYMMQVNLKL